MVLSNFKCILTISLALTASLGSSFSPQARPASRKSTTPLQVLEESSSLMVATESWRQYIFPIVTAGVLIDIVLGSPLANSVLAPLRGDAEAASDDEGGAEQQSAFGALMGGGGNKFDKTKLKERVDSEQIADAAIARARNSLELRKYLDDRKTDYDRMEEIKKQLDEGMQDFDSGYEANAKRLSAEMEKRGKSLE